MATATHVCDAGTSGNLGTAMALESGSMEFLIVEDNGGEYHWTLSDEDGHSLARSPSFATYEQAEDAAAVVLAGASSARLDRRPAGNS